MEKLIVHTASLYYWFDNYTDTLDDRIHAILDAGADGVEISNGAEIINWEPQKETMNRLEHCLVSIHAEVGESFGVSPAQIVKVTKKIPNFSHCVFHPDELDQWGIQYLKSMPYMCTLENLDGRADKWNTPNKIRVPSGIGFTYDTAHGMETNVSALDFSVTPYEVHLSLSNENDYYDKWGYKTRHALTQFNVDRFPYVPSGSPVVTIEGLVPPDKDILRDELIFIRRMLS